MADNVHEKTLEEEVSERANGNIVAHREASQGVWRASRARGVAPRRRATGFLMQDVLAGIMEFDEGVAQLRWYAVAVRAGREIWTSVALRGEGFELFVPRRMERRIWSDRVKQQEVPIFPGYAFVRTAMSAATRVRILRVKHTLDLVGRLRGEVRIARHVPDAEIESLRCMYAASYMVDPVQRLTFGTPVVVTAGPLQGVRGVVEVGPDDQRRLVVNITLLGRGIRTVLSGDDVVEAVGMDGRDARARRRAAMNQPVRAKSA